MAEPTKPPRQPRQKPAPGAQPQAARPPAQRPPPQRPPPQRPPAQAAQRPPAQATAPAPTGRSPTQPRPAPARTQRPKGVPSDSGALRRQQRVRAEQQMREADDLEAQAKQLREEAKQRKKRQADLNKHQEQVARAAPELGLDPNRPLVDIPALQPGFKQVALSDVHPPFAKVRVSFHPGRSEYLYEVLEPMLTDVERDVYEFIRDTLIRTLEGRGVGDNEQMLRDSMERVVTDHAVMIDATSTERIWYHLLRDFLGFGPIDVLMRDPQLEDISCDGPNVPLFLFHREFESITTNVMFEDEMELDGFVIRLAQQSGKHISIADPMLDATLPDGSRLQATLAREITTRGSSFTIRKFREEPMTPTHLMEFGTFSDELAAYLWFLMEHGHSLIMSGGTASGKTTTLNAICQFIPPEKKVVSIEDTREINLHHENWIAGVTRTGFGAADSHGRRAGTIDMYALLAAALRQRPEYLLVGEVRGAEALTLFQAMATGHAVYSTMHADSAESAVYRLENPPIEVPRMMLQTLDALAIQRQVRMGEKMVRRITSITEFVGFDAVTGDLLTNEAFSWQVGEDRHHFTGKSILLDKIRDRQNITDEEMQVEWKARVKVLQWMRQTEKKSLDDVSNLVSAYYHSRDDLMARVEAEWKDPDPPETNGIELPPADAHRIPAGPTSPKPLLIESEPKDDADEEAPNGTE